MSKTSLRFAAAVAAIVLLADAAEWLDLAPNVVRSGAATCREYLLRGLSGACKICARMSPAIEELFAAKWPVYRLLCRRSGKHENKKMQLSPREKDKLLVAMAAMVARKRRARRGWTGLSP